MKNSSLKSGLFLCSLLFFQHVRAEYPSAQELLDAHQASQATLEKNLQQDKENLKKQLISALLKLDQQARQTRDLDLRLWTHSAIRRIDELEENWLAILAEPFKRPDPIQQLFITTENAWNKLQSTATESVLENRKAVLDKMEKLQIRLVQEDRIDEAVITRDLRKKVNESREDEKRHAKITKFTPEAYLKSVQNLREKALASAGNEVPTPPPDALFPFKADNPAFQEFLKEVKVESSGFFAGSSAHIQIGRHPVYSGRRGVAMVAVHEGNIVLEDIFDTYVEQAESVRLSEEIGKLPYGAFVVLAVRDDATRRFTGSTQSSLYRLGAMEGILNLPYRSSYILIGMKGLMMGDAMELFDLKNKTIYNGNSIH